MNKLNLLALGVKTALFAGAMTSFTTVAAEEEKSVEKESVERIEVTGSRIKRHAEIAPNPVTVIGGEELINAGITNVADLLQNIPSRAPGSAPTTTTNTIGLHNGF